MSLTPEEKSAIVADYAKNPGDTGSVEVQIALLTHTINKLTEHFKQHKHDYHSRRGLLKLVSRRRNLLAYLRRKNLKGFFELAKRLELRVTV